ncbi:MAG: hypothetical protein ACE15E_03140 [Acidobacteriota bacterium]
MPSLSDPRKSLPADLVGLTEELLKGLDEHLAEDTDRSEFPDLLSFEEWAGELTRRLGREMIGRFLAMRARQARQTPMMCPKCGQAMQRHKRSIWNRQTPFGAVRVEDDAYFYCRDCHTAARPLHPYLGTERETWSLLVQEAAVDLATDESCQKAVEKLARHHPGVEMNRTTALRFLHHHGMLAREFVGRKLRQALMKAAGESRRHRGAVELEVEYDGGMVPVATLHPIPVAPGEAGETTPVRGLPKRKKECGWEEVKVGLVQVPGEVSRLYSVRPTEELDEAFEDLLALACLKDWSEHTRVRGIVDGAQYIRTRMEDTFHACQFRFILDRPHAKRHLCGAGQLLAEASLIGISAEQWSAAALDHLEKGEVQKVIDELRTAFERTGDDRIRRAFEYFDRNQDAVAYAEYREKGWSTASSEVESSHRHVVQVRLKIPGAWWHPDNVPNILALRMLKANRWWDEYWQLQRELWRQRAQGLAAKRRPSDPEFPS